MTKVAFIIHGKINRNEGLREKLVKALPSGFELEFHETQYPRHATELTANALKNGANYAIAVGGDGLLNEVANGYMQCPEDIKKQSAIGVFPSGTGNDFCKTIGVKADMRQLSSLLQQNSVKPLDICHMRFRDVNHEPIERYFINIADIGIGGYVSQRVNNSSKLFGSKLSYMKAIILTFLTYRHRSVRITADDFSWEGKVLLVVMANGKYFGSGLCIAPQAAPDDGKMQLVLLANVSLFDYLKQQGKVRRGEIIDHPEVKYLESTSCTIEPLEECTIDMDGEFVGYGPIKTRVERNGLRFLRK